MAGLSCTVEKMSIFVTKLEGTELPQDADSLVLTWLGKDVIDLELGPILTETRKHWLVRDEKDQVLAVCMPRGSVSLGEWSKACLEMVRGMDKFES